MTLHQFNAGVKQYKRYSSLMLGAVGLAAVVYGAVVISFARDLSNFGASLFGWEHVDLIRAMLLLPLVVAVLGGAVIVQLLTHKDRRVMCPHCESLLVDRPVRLVTVATHNCPFCGKQVIDAEGARD
jgi:hypothetical protein